jgi:A/G-specific adenine glycosylase
MIGNMGDYDSLHTALIGWFKANQEALPWRHDRSAYKVWLSEIMLQQTQVSTVVPYYERFLSRFPDVNALAAAPLEDVLKAWEGLGYYSRARNLHRCAQIIVREYEGIFPSTVASLGKLPGIGPYTAGAIASLAFGLDAPVLDGNLIRVFARLFDIDEDITQTQTKRRLWKLAEQVLPPGRAGVWNEGLMELGRRICIPRAPRCDQCPVSHYCRARQHSVQALRPVRQRKTRTPHFDVTAAVLYQPNGLILIAQRPLDGMLGGLWEFPGGKCQLGETLPECLAREMQEELGVEIAVGPQIAVIKHGYTHFRITLFAYLCRLVSGTPQTLGCADWKWVTLEEMDRYAFPATDRKIINVLKNNGLQALDFEPLVTK